MAALRRVRGKGLGVDRSEDRVDDGIGEGRLGFKERRRAKEMCVWVGGCGGGGGGRGQSGKQKGAKKGYVAGDALFMLFSRPRNICFSSQPSKDINLPCTLRTRSPC